MDKEKRLMELESQYKRLKEEIDSEKAKIAEEKKKAESIENYKKDYDLVEEAINKQCCHVNSLPLYYAVVNGKVFQTLNGNSLFTSEGRVISAIKTSIRPKHTDTMRRNIKKVVDELVANGTIVVNKLVR